MNDFDLRKYLAENRLLKEEIMVDTTVMVDPNNTLMSKASDEEIDYIKANITNVPKMSVEDFQERYDEYFDRFYSEGDPLDLQIKALQIHIDKGVLTREEAIKALAMLQGQDVEEFEDMFLAENRLLKEDQTDLFVKAGFIFDDGLLGGVGSGGGGYYDFISDKISGYHIDKFDEEEFNNWYDNFSKKDFNSLVYDSKLMGDYEIDPSGLPKGIHQLDTAGAGEVMDDMITIYAYPTLVDENGGEFITIFSLDKNGNIVPEISKEEVKAKLASNEYSII